MLNMNMVVGYTEEYPKAPVSCLSERSCSVQSDPKWAGRSCKIWRRWASRSARAAILSVILLLKLLSYWVWNGCQCGTIPLKLKPSCVCARSLSRIFHGLCLLFSLFWHLNLRCVIFMLTLTKAKGKTNLWITYLYRAADTTRWK